jgi:hypothetical protein
MGVILNLGVVWGLDIAGMLQRSASAGGASRQHSLDALLVINCERRAW